jgi:hypothetical protein
MGEARFSFNTRRFQKLVKSEQAAWIYAGDTLSAGMEGIPALLRSMIRLLFRIPFTQAFLVCSRESCMLDFVHFLQ